MSSNTSTSPAANHGPVSSPTALSPVSLPALTTPSAEATPASARETTSSTTAAPGRFRRMGLKIALAGAHVVAAVWGIFTQCSASAMEDFDDFELV